MENFEKTMNNLNHEIGIEVLKGKERPINSLFKIEKTNSDSSLTGYFPKTRYYGSKYRLLNFISDALQPLSYNTVADLFGGTGTVSLMFKYKNKDVTYNDILKSNCLMAKAVLSSTEVKKDEITEFFEDVLIKFGTVSELYEGIYFTDAENNWLDGAIEKLKTVDDTILSASLYYCLFQACLQKRPFNLFHRKNLYIRQNCSRKTSFGNWITWERPFQELIARSAAELSKRTHLEVGKANIIKPTNASDINSGFDLVYIDPPYLGNSKNSLNYMDRYHFLEGLCDYDNWHEKIQFSKKNRSIKAAEEVLQWNSKGYFKDYLFDLIGRHRKSAVVLSYASGGVS